MAIREIRLKEDEILKKKAKQIDKIDEKVKELAQDMLDTMYENDGIGLAACQVGILKSLVVYDVEYVDEKRPRKKPVIMINPKITSVSKSMVTVEEGCLSFPNVFEKVDRHEKVTVEFLDLNGKKQIKHAKGLEAVCIQHEVDHLSGVVFLDYV